jgi:histone H3/H4
MTLENQIEPILTHIENMLFNANFISTKQKRHTYVQDHVFNVLIKHGFTAYREYKLKVLSRAHQKERSGPYRRLKTGAIDIYGKASEFEIGVEFDSKEIIKYGSLEKLCQSNARICIMLVLGPKTIDAKSVSSNFEENKNRLWKVLKETIADLRNERKKIDKLKHKRFFLGVVRTCLLRELSIDIQSVIESILNQQSYKNKTVIISSKSYKVVHGRILEKNNKSLLVYIKEYEKEILIPRLAFGPNYTSIENKWQEIEVQRWFLEQEGLLKDEAVITEHSLKRVISEEKWNRLSKRAADILITTLRNYITDMLQTSIELTEHSKRTKLKEKDIIFADELIKLRFE